MRKAGYSLMWGLATGCIGSHGLSARAAAEGTAVPENFANLSLEELSDVRVVSVSKREERLGDAPASVFVISADDIRRSGARSLAEALRLAPNLHVAQAPVGGYTITARGFSGNSANKQLVMIDGRSVYTPLFAGVFWDVQQLPMDSIERIEVVSGPGGTLWGTNAVNGVINVITKSAEATAGAMADLRWGQDQSGAAFRYGGAMADGAWRAYGMDYAMPHGETLNGAALGDAWHTAQAGFRADWLRGSDAFTLQGDAYRTGEGQIPTQTIAWPLAASMRGANLMGHWTRQFEHDASLALQAYYDRTERDLTGMFQETLDIVDVQGLYNFSPLGRHTLALGAEYRAGRDQVTNVSGTGFRPDRANMHWASLFGQDTIALGDKVNLTGGLRVERNMYTGTELLPNLRLAWKATPSTFWWAALSRTVRAPSRVDREIYINAGSRGALAGGPDFESETARVLELGLRQQFGSRASYSVTLYRALYDHLRTIKPVRPLLYQIGNGMVGETRGLEAWGSYQATPAWRLGAGLTVMHEEFSIKAGETDFLNLSVRGNTDPRRMAKLRSSLTLGEGRDLDVTLRYVGPLRFSTVAGYTALDVNFNWQLKPGLELALGASNALDRVHEEFGGTARLALGRGAYLRLVSYF
ncbi:TonB-dependent receptor plug domain-containing protein [Pseudoduganella violaceinigra]|uniref:TonB-dependent receptor plug domain-containing protein n=1 Tax=Pseudoduganella violaceinigra TaxID=246602 RepID=UPI00041DE3B6|nr:TonB-dependent receptor [Pseudoduganella violaceinigra]